MVKKIVMEEEVLGEKIYIKGIYLGEDLNLAIMGGEQAHIGSVSIATPRESLTGVGASATISTYVFPGHKDDQVGNLFAKAVCTKLQKKVVVSCGIHFNQISEEEILKIIDKCKEMLGKLLCLL